MVQFMRQLWGFPLSGDCAPRASSKDTKGTYRQCNVSPEQLCYSAIYVGNVEAGQWMFAILCGLAFGLTSAVIQFNGTGTCLEFFLGYLH